MLPAATISIKPATTSASSHREPTREQFNALRSQFHYFNAKLFAGELPEVMLNMSRHAKSYGFFAPDRWKLGGTTEEQGKDAALKTHEISLNPDHFGRDARAVASTLVHEMVHLWQEVLGKKKGSKGYHNKEWGTKMETIGLMPSSTGSPGGRRTGKNMTHYVLDGGAFARAWLELPEEYKMPWRSGIGLLGDASAPKPRKKDPSKMKFSCGCGNNLWGKKDLRVTCNDCAAEFKIQDDEDDD